MKLRFLLINIFIVATTCYSAGQIRFYGNGELSCNFVTEICQSGDGFIWIGTANGLNKFDGWTFSRYFYKSNDEKSLLSDYVYSLYTDKKGMLWVGTNKGLQRYLPYEDAFQSVCFPENQQPSVEGIIELHTGEIWIVTSGKGVYSVDSETMKATALDEVNNACGSLFLSDIYEDSNHTIWIALSNNKVLRVLENSKKRFRIFDMPDVVQSFVENHDGQLYISMTGNISRWDAASQSFVLVKNLPATFLKPVILCSKKGTVYMGMYGQGLRYMESDFTEMHRIGGIANRYVNLENIKIEAIMEDKDGNIWVGCFRKGLFMIPNESSLFNFWNFSEMEYKSGNCISSLYRGWDGMIWAGTENGEIMNIDESGNIVNSYTSLSKPVSSLFEDSEGTFWAGTNFGGLFKFNKKSGNSVAVSGFETEYIKAVVEDKDRNVYFSVFGKGLALYNMDLRKWTSLSGNNDYIPLKNNWVNITMCDHQGRVWVGHYNGIDCYDPKTERFNDIEGDSILYTTVCYSLLEGKDGEIWIGTNNGLYTYNSATKKFTHYSTEDGLPDNVICGLAKDSAGNIWCSTYRGLCKINVHDRVIYPYSSGNGLFDKEYTRGVYFQYKNRDVYLSGVYGITHFIPDSIHVQEYNKEPVLTNLYLNNNIVSPHTISAGRPICNTVLTEASSLNFSYHDNTFTLEFSTMDYNEPENIHYEYRMLEVNNEWSQTPPGYNRITYNRLQPGKYTLDIRACENGIYSPIKTLSIVIVPPWYLSMVAKVCYILATLLLMGIIVQALYRRSVKRRQEEINEAKLQFFTNISHELRSPITLIMSPLSMLMKKEYDEVTTKALNTMNRNVNRIAGLLNQLLDIRRIDKGLMKLTYSETDIVAFVKDIMKGFEYQADKWNILFNIEHDTEDATVWIDQGNFDKVLINLLSNAFKFTPEGGEITITISIGEDKSLKTPLRNHLELCVKDSGLGLDEKKLERIFERFYQLPTVVSSGSGIGLNLCKTLVELHHGTITAVNRKDIRGSIFTVRIPLGCEHLNAEEIANPDTLLHKEPERNAYFEEKSVTNKQKEKSTSKSKILIIDDDESICLYLEQELKHLFCVVACNNGSEGLRVALDIVPDLIISDVMMPEMDGYALLKSIKKNSNISHIPVILLTSRAEYDYRIKGWDKGADAILAKPFNVEELLLLCTNLISGRRHLQKKFTGIQDQREKVKPIGLKSDEERMMERMMNVINNNLNDPQLNVEQLARKVGMSRVQLHRRLKEMLGISTGEFIRNIRLTQAAKLLESKNISISQVAYAVGYSNPSLFSAAFKKFYGLSPSEYIEKNLP